MKSIIKKIKGKDHQINKHISEITGEHSCPDPDYWENTETGEIYSHKKWEGIHLTPPYDLERSNNFEIYYRQMDSYLDKNNKRLFLDSGGILGNYVQNLPPDIAIKGDIDSFPAVFVLGALIHTLLMLKPWKKPLGRQRLYPTSYVDYASREAERTKRHLFGGNSNPGHSSRDDLINTINEN
jgi:hypothetical protein